MEELLAKINECKTMPALDNLRIECATFCQQNTEQALKIQQAFIKKKHQLKRIPLKDRQW